MKRALSPTELVRVTPTYFPKRTRGKRESTVRAYIPSAGAYVVQLYGTEDDADDLMIVHPRLFVEQVRRNALILDDNNLPGFKWPIGTKLWKTYDSGITDVAGRSLCGKKVEAIVIHHLEVHGERHYVLHEPSNMNYEDDSENWWAAYDVRRETGDGLRAKK